jgi:hypothetical protein
MLELPVTALGSDVLPAFALKLLDEVTNLHAALRPKKRCITSELTGASRLARGLRMQAA